MSAGLWDDVKALTEQVAQTRRRADRAEATLARVEKRATTWTERDGGLGDLARAILRDLRYPEVTEKAS